VALKRPEFDINTLADRNMHAYSARVSHRRLDYSPHAMGEEEEEVGQRSGLTQKPAASYLARGAAPAADRGRRGCSLGRSTRRCRPPPPMRFAAAR